MNEVRLKIAEKFLSLGADYLNLKISDLNSPKRLEEMTIKTKLVNFDYSKQKIDQKAMDYLLKVPDQINLKESFENLLHGEFYNPSENRNVSHTLYRSQSLNDRFKLVFTERERIKELIDKIHSNSHIKNIICISIGGSRLGPEFLSEFLSPRNFLKVHFCSSYDLFELKDSLLDCKQEETIVFAASKSFETVEILKNLDYVKFWFGQAKGIDPQEHIFAISSNVSAMTDHGINKTNQFEVLDTLNGRFSVWSSMSLPAFINTNNDDYLSFLEGAYLADQHILSSSWDQNIPVIMALLSIWNSTSLGINNHGIFTYNFRLRSLTKYIAQLSMESCGKSINFKGDESPFLTSPLVWGGYGIEEQHSTFQWLMQAKTETSCDFVGVNDENKESSESQEMLLSQVIAITNGEKNILSPYKAIQGNKPCSIVQLNSLDLKTLGFLLALYEHKVFVESLILGIDAFDQWGVQLAKKLASSSKGDKEFFRNYFGQDFLPKS